MKYWGPVPCLNPSCFHSVADLCAPLTSASHSCTSQLYSDLRDAITWVDAQGQTQKHKIDLLSYASLPNLLPLHTLLLKSVVPSLSHLQSKLQDFYYSFSAHTYHVSHRFSYSGFTLTYSCLSGLTTLTSSLWSEPQVPWKMTFNSVLLSASVCSYFTAVVWCPSRDPALKFWLFNYISLNGVLVRLAAWVSTVYGLQRKIL